MEWLGTHVESGCPLLPVPGDSVRASSELAASISGHIHSTHGVERRGEEARAHCTHCVALALVAPLREAATEPSAAIRPDDTPQSSALAPTECSDFDSDWYIAA